MSLLCSVSVLLCFVVLFCPGNNDAWTWLASSILFCFFLGGADDAVRYGVGKSVLRPVLSEKQT